MSDNIKLCDVIDNCEDCPRYADDCDGRSDDNNIQDNKQKM